jgi:hypothetical protein
MACIEPILAEFCRHLNRMAKSINQTEFLALANDITEGTTVSSRIREFQSRICGINKEKKLGQKYFYNFMKRHKSIIHTTKVNKQCVSRLEWATYHNIEKMYSLIYEELVNSGIAIKLPEYCYFNKDNQIVAIDDVEAYGISSNVQVTDPSYFIFVDETGSSTNMKMDKKGTKKVIAEKGYTGSKQAITTDLRYTTMGFTAATGEPIMCCIIFSSESTKGIPINWVTGIDLTKIDADFEIREDEEGLMDNVRNSGAVCGGPSCFFKNKHVPCFIQYSGHGGITPTILTNCLRKMDFLELFPRVDGK